MFVRAFRRLWYLVNRRRFERELEREMAAHRAEMGDSRGFGSALRLREQAADVWGWAWLDDLWHDLRYGLRQLRRTPGFTLVAVLTLALGIGVNVAAFSVVKTMFLTELPVPEPGALRQFEWGGSRAFSASAFRHLRDHASGFSALTCVASSRLTLERGDDDTPVTAAGVSGEFFGTFGAAMAAGRPLTPADDRPGAPPAAVISYDLWQRMFAAEASAVGSAVAIRDVPIVIVGVTRPGFSTAMNSRPPDVMLPMTLLGLTDGAARSPREASCRIVGRLADLRAEERIRQESERLLRASGMPLPIDREPPGLRDRLRLRLWPAGRGIDEVRFDRLAMADDLPQLAGGLFLLLTVLVVPCANVGAMLLARAITRRPEIVARLALGASRARLIRQLLTEGALLAIAAGIVGVLIAWTLRSAAFPELGSSRIDGPVLAMTAALCALATLSFALAPALTATRGDLASRIRESSAGISGRTRTAPGAVLVALQVLVSCILLAVALLQARSLVAATPAEGSEPDRVLLVNLSPSRGGTLEDVEEVLGRLARVPGVISVAASGTDGLYTTLCTEVDGRAGRETPVSLWAVSPGYFATMKIPLHQGREFDGTDTRTTDDVVVVNDVLARSLFGRIDPVGRRLPLVGCQPGDPAAPSGPLTIVGVADDTHGAPAIYLPYAQLSPEGPMWTAGLSAVTLAARGTGHAALLARPVRHALREAAPTATVGAVQTEANLLERRLKAVRLLTALYVLLGLLATGQAAFGLYGTVSQFVSRRTAEIGVRVVFGAGTLDVVRLVVRQALTPVVAGLLLGLAASPLVARVMWAARLTGEAGWGELLAIAAGIALVMVAAFAAASVPVWRVSRMDPAAALREE